MKSLSGKRHWKLESFAKKQGIWFAQVVISLIQIQDIAIFVIRFSKFFAVSFTYEIVANF